MGISVADEVYIFFAMVVLGGILGVLFDVFRVIRKVKKMNTAFVAVSDFVFLVCALILVTGGMLYFNNGQLRWFEFFGLFLGALIYFLLLSHIIICVFVKIIEVFTKIISYILKILLTPLMFLYKILTRPIIFIYCGLKKVFGGLLCRIKRLFFRERVKDTLADNKNKKTKTKTKKKRHILGWSVFIVVCIMFVNTAMQQPKILKNKKEIASLNEQIEYEDKKSQEIDALKAKVNTDEYIEKVAREKLGLIKENEKIFIDVASQ